MRVELHHEWFFSVMLLVPLHQGSVGSFQVSGDTSKIDERKLVQEDEMGIQFLGSVYVQTPKHSSMHQSYSWHCLNGFDPHWLADEVSMLLSCSNKRPIIHDAFCQLSSNFFNTAISTSLCALAIVSAKNTDFHKLLECSTG